MINKIKDIHQKIKEWVTNVLIKKYLSPMLLIFIYFFVLGPTSLVAKIFFRKYLIRGSNSSETNWSDFPEMSDDSFNTTSQS